MASHSYILQSGGLTNFASHFPELSQYSQFVILTHPNLKKLYGKTLINALKSFQKPIIEFSLPAGELTKDLKHASSCWRKMADKRIDHKALVIALGGGVICDLAGFVASCYMRGIDTYYVPTTLLAMVDAAFGGKTAINFHGKNRIGTFHFPQKVLVDPHLLHTLPPREFRAGLAEMIKHGMISDTSYLNELEWEMEQLLNFNQKSLEKMIASSIKLKLATVAQDPLDKEGIRAFLNYGHTFAHAIEKISDYHLYLHGEAVALGMSCAAQLSAHLGLCAAALPKQQERLIHKAQLPTRLNSMPIEALIEAMRSDKKGDNGKINLILPQKIGKVFVANDVDPFLIKQILLSKMD